MKSLKQLSKIAQKFNNDLQSHTEYLFFESDLQSFVEQVEKKLSSMLPKHHEFSLIKDDSLPIALNVMADPKTRNVLFEVKDGALMSMTSLKSLIHSTVKEAYEEFASKSLQEKLKEIESKVKAGEGSGNFNAFNLNISKE